MGNPNWNEAHRLAIYKRGREVEYGTRRTHTSQCLSFPEVSVVFKLEARFGRLVRDR